MKNQLCSQLQPASRRGRHSAGLRAAIGCAALAATAACGGSTPTGVTCTTDFLPGLLLKVQNATTGAPVTDSAAVQVRDGSYLETYFTLGTSGTISAAGERPGVYSVSIRKAGFAAYDTAGVRVTKDACHVQTVTVVANLAPVSSN